MILALLLKNRLSSLSTLRLGWFTDPIILITAKEMKYKTHERGSVAEKYFTIQRMPVKDRQDKKDRINSVPYGNRRNRSVRG